MVSGTLCPISDCVMFDVHETTAPEGPMTYGTLRAFPGLLRASLTALRAGLTPLESPFGKEKRKAEREAEREAKREAK